MFFSYVLRQVFGHKIRVALSAFAIIASVAFVGGSLIFTDTLSRSFTSLFESTVPDVTVRPAGGGAPDGSPSTRTISAKLVDRLAETPGVARADGTVDSFGVFVISVDNKVVGGNGAPGIATNWTGAPGPNGLDGLIISAGRAPDGADEVLLDAKAAERGGYFVGQRIKLVTNSAEDILEPRLVGLVEFADGGSLNGATLTVFDTARAQELFLDGKNRFNEVRLTAASGTSQQEVKDAVAPTLSDDLEAITGDALAEESASDLQEAIGFFQTFLLVFAAIAVVVSTFMIVNTFAILVAQRSRELALQRALGASRGQVLRMVLTEAFVIGMAGSTLGLPAGYALAAAFRFGIGLLGLDISSQPLVVESSTVIACYAVGVLVTMAAALIPALRTGRIAPVQAMRDDIALPEASVRRRLIIGLVLLAAGGAMLYAGLFVDSVDRPLWFVGAGILALLLGVSALSPALSRPLLSVATALYTAVFGAVGRLAGTNSHRNPRRTAATASALMIGLALAGTMSVIGSSANASVDATIDENFVGDYLVSATFGQDFSTKVGDRMERVEGVESVTRLRGVAAEYKGDFTFVFGATKENLAEVKSFAMLDGQLSDLVDGVVIVSKTWATDQGVKQGDTISLQMADGAQDFRIAAVFEPNAFISSPIVATPQTLLDAGYPDVDNFLIIETGGADLRVQRALEAVVADNPIVTVKDQAAFADEQRAPINQLLATVYALLGLAVFIAFLGIVNTLILSVIERTRELGLLRAIGLDRAATWRMITLESVVIAVLGALLGVAMGIGFGVSIVYALRDDGLEVISLPVGQLTIFVVSSIVVGVIAAVIPAWRAARLDVLSAIATE